MNRKNLILIDKTIVRILFFFAAVSARFRRTQVDIRPRLPRRPHFAVIRPGGLGDGIMSIPFLRCLRREFPTSRITLVCVTKNRAVFDLISYHDELVVLDDLTHTIQQLWRLNRTKLDVLFDLEPFRRTSSLVSWLSGAKTRVGFDTNSRRKLYTHLVTYAEESCSEPENMLNQLAVVGMHSLSEEARDTHISLTAEHRDTAKKRISAAGLDPESHFFVGVGVGTLKPENEWVMSEFALLIDSILAEDERTRVILLGSAEDMDNTEQVMQCINNTKRVIDLVAKTSITETLSILELCQILVVCDGGLVHMGSAMGCKTVSLWGPGPMQRFKPIGKDHIGIRKEYWCIPCISRERLGDFPGCPYNRRCLNDIKAAQVMDGYLLHKGRVDEIADESQ